MREPDAKSNERDRSTDSGDMAAKGRKVDFFREPFRAVGDRLEVETESVHRRKQIDSAPTEVLRGEEIVRIGSRRAEI